MSVKRFTNILSFVVTPIGGQAITFLGCQSLSVAVNSSLMKGAGDGDPGPSSIDMDYQEPTLGLKFEDIEPALIAPLDGKRCSITALVGLSGAKSKSAGIQIVLSPAVALTKSATAAYRKYADADVEFHGIFVDGVNPLACTFVPDTTGG